MKTKLIVGILLLISLSFRFWTNFHEELLPGINGGYYPLQVRCILENGALGFPDFPLLFYFDAGIVRLLSFLGFEANDALILLVVKCVDALSLPCVLLLLYPLFKKIKNDFYAIFLVFGMASLSFAPLHLIAELQKNTLAIVFVVGSFSQLILFAQDNQKKHIGYSALFFVLTAMTHFGTFQFSMVYLSLLLLLQFGKKAILPTTLFVVLSVSLVAVFDYSRFVRIFSLKELFEHPFILGGFMPPPEIVQVLVAYIFIYAGFRFQKQLKDFPLKRNIVLASILALVFFSFPLISGQFVHRFSLFYFIPETMILVLYIEFNHLSRIKKVSLSIYLLLSILGGIMMPQTIIMPIEVYTSLDKIKSKITLPATQTLIVTKHGWEWWTAWKLNTHVAQEKGLTKNTLHSYRKCFALREQKRPNGFGRMPPFPEVTKQKNDETIFSNAYIEVDSIQLKEHIGKAKMLF